eukprot:gene4080-4419_t
MGTAASTKAPEQQRPDDPFMVTGAKRVRLYRSARTGADVGHVPDPAVRALPTPFASAAWALDHWKEIRHCSQPPPALLRLMRDFVGATREAVRLFLLQDIVDHICLAPDLAHALLYVAYCKVRPLRPAMCLPSAQRVPSPQPDLPSTQGPLVERLRLCFHPPRAADRTPQVLDFKHAPPDRDAVPPGAYSFLQAFAQFCVVPETNLTVLRPLPPATFGNPAPLHPPPPQVMHCYVAAHCVSFLLADDEHLNARKRLLVSHGWAGTSVRHLTFLLRAVHIPKVWRESRTTTADLWQLNIEAQSALSRAKGEMFGDVQQTKQPPTFRRSLAKTFTKPETRVPFALVLEAMHVLAHEPQFCTQLQLVASPADQGQVICPLLLDVICSMEVDIVA